MTVVSDSSPLISLARIGCLDLLSKLYGKIYIFAEVYNEIVVAGAGLPGAVQIAQADWIEVRPVQHAAGLAGAISNTGLGAGELSAVILAKELAAGLVLVDESRAPRYAREQGLAVVGCVGILEELYAARELNDLRGAYQRMLQQKVRIDLQTLQLSLAKFNLPALT